MARDCPSVKKADIRLIQELETRELRKEEP
jgi:hypothetical protein